MTKEHVREWMRIGYEIEFESDGKKYSLCPFLAKDGKIWFSFCEFHKDTLDVPDIDTLLVSTYHGMKVSDIFEPVPEDQVDGL